MKWHADLKGDDPGTFAHLTAEEFAAMKQKQIDELEAMDTARLFDPGKPDPRPRQAPRKLMHVVDAGPCDACDYETIVVMECHRCDLKTDWFAMRNVTAAKRGIECPRCAGKDFAVNTYGEYVP